MNALSLKSTVELRLSRLIGTARLWEIGIIGFFIENRVHWQFEVRLLLFTVCTASKTLEHA